MGRYSGASMSIVLYHGSGSGDVNLDEATSNPDKVQLVNLPNT